MANSKRRARRKRRKLLYEETCAICCLPVYLKLRDWRKVQDAKDGWELVFGPYCEDCVEDPNDKEAIVGITRNIKLLTNGREVEVAELLAQ